MKPLPVKDLPKALPLKRLIGPSFILLGLGLGSGEVILWPYLTSNYGLGIIWGALLGLTFQFFMNMEIERYALINGESIFVGFARKCRLLPWWFIISTFIPWLWPGIAVSSATLLGSAFGYQNYSILAIILILIMGLILTLGPVLYKTLENFQKMVIFVGVPTILVLSIFLADKSDYLSLLKGSLGVGEGYLWLPIGIPLASFLAALAYSGAGGNLNLAQSFYIREKGYGMGKYAGKITGLLTGKSENLILTGNTFKLIKANLREFQQWWRNINIEHFLIFWLTGSVTILLLGLLSYVTTYGMPGNQEGITFVIREAEQIGRMTLPIFGIAFLLVTGLTLFGTQMTVYDATSRILTENILLAYPNINRGHSIRKLYYGVLWWQLLAAIMVILLGFNQPLQLLILAAVLNAVAMFIHIGLTVWVNKTLLHQTLQPNQFRLIMMLLAFIFYGSFSLYTIYNYLT